MYYVPDSFLPARRYASAGTSQCSHGPMSVCLSVCRKLECSLETDERIELVFGMGAYFRPSYTVLKGNSGISKDKGTSPGTLSQTRDLENFASMYRSSKRVIDLARERWTLRE